MPRLCDLCRQIPFDFFEKESSFSHRTVSELEKLSPSCQFCNIIFQSLKLALRRGKYHNLYGINFIIRSREEQVVLDWVPAKRCLVPTLPQTGAIGVDIETKVMPQRGAPQKTLSKLPGSSENIILLKDWMVACRSKHAGCRQLDLATTEDCTLKLPTRLLELKGGKATTLRIIDTKNVPVDEAKNLKYIALSYCWGKIESPVLDKESMQAYYDTGIPIEDVPQTIRDAAWLCEQLQVRYLWADRFCIIQNDPSDWATEAGRMCDVYRKSWLTIAAATSTEMSDGFLTERDHSLVESCTLLWPRGADVQNAVVLYPVLETIAETLTWNPLSLRGWTLQERHLAPRIVYFTPKQMVWECPTTAATEAIPGYCFSGIPNFSRIQRVIDLVPEPSIRRKDVYWRWMMVVLEYSRRELTRSTDKLPAISGLAAQVQRLTGDEYLAGIWKGDLIRQMLWHAEDGMRPDTSTILRRAVSIGKPARAPSWTWAAVDGAVQFFWDLEPDKNKGPPDILDAKVSVSSNNAFGHVSTGVIRLRGCITVVINGNGCFVWISGPAFLLDSPGSNRYTVYSEDGVRFGYLVFDVFFPPPDQIVLLRMWEQDNMTETEGILALILYPVNDNNGIDDMEFKRIGWGEFGERARQLFVNEDLEDLRIF